MSPTRYLLHQEVRGDEHKSKFHGWHHISIRQRTNSAEQAHANPRFCLIKVHTPCLIWFDPQNSGNRVRSARTCISPRSVTRRTGDRLAVRARISGKAGGRGAGQLNGRDTSVRDFQSPPVLVFSKAATVITGAVLSKALPISYPLDLVESLAPGKAALAERHHVQHASHRRLSGFKRFARSMVEKAARPPASLTQRQPGRIYRQRQNCVCQSSVSSNAGLI